ncbi:hypothetical protein LTR70_009096 [Exophiala xenobiotica]|uniref:Uncharacterized protein n=1 Tax=Lithohypha guttulata TaxID=1690604 RepID=A0ABR0JYV6_9EURO|nr:hypothetical protein LTR24_008788 [Lithohypha guttulata]KAK5310972.1 hypothetical protein LTR70_009096 [Exophiala xenobiotica]
MFRRYQEAVRCYIYLDDVPKPSSGRLALRKSKWFTRGWTLQELLAPASVGFFSADGQQTGTKSSLESDISEVTGIPIKALQGQPVSDYSVSERLAWANNRKTTRKEDKAYCLLGIFDVYLSLIYGEGSNAFVRLGDAVDQRSKRTVNHGRWSINKSGVLDSMSGGRVKCVRCPSCYWEYTSGKSSYPQPTLAGGQKVPYEVMWQKFHHTEGKESTFRCFICRDGTARHWDDMKEHIEEEHTWAEIYGKSTR